MYKYTFQAYIFIFIFQTLLEGTRLFLLRGSYIAGSKNGGSPRTIVSGSVSNEKIHIEPNGCKK